MEQEHGYLQHGQPPGPFRTEWVRIKHTMPDIYHARYEGVWRKVYATMARTYIRHKGARITILIEGV